MGVLQSRWGLVNLPRTDAYKSASSLWQKMVWWHDNLWSNEVTWAIGSALVLGRMEGMGRRDALLPDPDKEDWIRCITHLANAVRGPVRTFM